MLDGEQMHTTTITIPAVENGNILKHYHQQPPQQQQQNESLPSSPKKHRNQHRSHPPNNNGIISASSDNNTATENSYTSTVSLSTIVSSDPDQDGKSTERLQSRPHNILNRKSCISFQHNLTENYSERGRRRHGLEFPLHPLQIGGWIAIFGFGVSTFCVLIPALDLDLQILLYYIVGCLYVIHCVSHLAALLIDPSDAELRKQSASRIVPEFDRTKHAHVIENRRCHLCNITTNFRTKHCSVCNKCVAQFDHHCVWLNHCVGGRNYVAFLMCVVSAVITAMVILAAVIAELVLYYVKSEWLIMWKVGIANVTTLNRTDTFLNQTDPMSSTIFNDTFIASINDTTIMSDSIANATDTMFDVPRNGSTAAILAAGISLHDTIFLAFISVLGILAAISVGLLLHLCFFHVYISFLGLTTYEYIRNQRQLDTQKDKKLPTTILTTNNKTTLNALKKSSSSSSSTLFYFCSHIDPKNLVENHKTKTKHRPKSIHCCDTTMQYVNTTHDAFYLCSILHDRPSPILVPTSMAHELTLNSSRASRSKVFHCCSAYKQVVKLSDTSSHRGYNDDATSNNDGSATETSSIGEHVKFFEQCTCCSFKLKTADRKVSAITNRPTTTTSHKSVFKRKWNCCSNVPESPDADVTMAPSQQQQQQHIDTISESIEPKSNRHHHVHHRLRGAHDEHKSNYKNGAKSTENGSSKIVMEMTNSKKTRSSLSTNLKGCNRSRATTQTTTWPLRLRYMLRVFGRCQQPHYAQQSPATTNNTNGNGCENEIKLQSHARKRSSSPRRNIKQNQIRPMDSIEQQQLQQPQRHRQSHDPNANNHTPNNLHKIDATNRHNDIADLTDANNPTNKIVSNSNSMQIPPPAPPARRKICQTVDMQDLAESLSFVQNPSHHHHHFPSRANRPNEQPKVSVQAAQRSIGSANNRRRRKNVFRTRSPNLSPIHESGYSNPTSPQPCRHSSSHGSDSSVSISKMSHQQRKNNSVA